MREVFAAYEEESGTPVDVARVRYHRLYFQLGFSVGSHAALYALNEVPIASLGTMLTYNTMHKRVIVSSIAEAMGVRLADPPFADCAADWTDRGYASALEDFRSEIVPCVTSQRASVKAKDMVRLVKFWRGRARYGAAFDAAEIAEIGALLGTAPAGVWDARAGLANAINEDRIDRVSALRLCHNRMARETHIMADAMGALATTWYEDLN